MGFLRFFRVEPRRLQTFFLLGSCCGGLFFHSPSVLSGSLWGMTGRDSDILLVRPLFQALAEQNLSAFSEKWEKLTKKEKRKALLFSGEYNGNLFHALAKAVPPERDLETEHQRTWSGTLDEVIKEARRILGFRNTFKALTHKNLSLLTPLDTARNNSIQSIIKNNLRFLVEEAKITAKTDFLVGSLSGMLSLTAFSQYGGFEDADVFAMGAFAGGVAGYYCNKAFRTITDLSGN